MVPKVFALRDRSQRVNIRKEASALTFASVIHRITETGYDAFPSAHGASAPSPLPQWFIAPLWPDLAALTSAMQHPRRTRRPGDLSLRRDSGSGTILR